MKIDTITVNTEEIYDYFYQAELELKNKNRFHNEKLDKIINYIFSSEANKITIKKGTILYRARIYDNPDAELKHSAFSESKFKGYNAIESYVNLNFDKVIDGRCNPYGIPYLYASQSQQCCIHEVRPIIEEYVSVAEIDVLNNLKILDLSTETIFLMKSFNEEQINSIPIPVFCQHLYKLFKRPYQQRCDYLVTQYVAEKIKNRGYDGIRYTSSLYKGEQNQNYVIFSFEKCKAINSRLFKITGNMISYE